MFFPNLLKGNIYFVMIKVLDWRNFATVSKLWNSANTEQDFRFELHEKSPCPAVDACSQSALQLYYLDLI